jgi:hypothetical protein
MRAVIFSPEPVSEVFAKNIAVPLHMQYCPKMAHVENDRSNNRTHSANTFRKELSGKEDTL